MKTPLLLLFLCFACCLSAQSVEDLETKLKNASSSEEKMVIQLDLAEALLSKDPKKAGDFARKSFDLAGDKRNYGMAAQASYLLANSYQKRRDDRNAEVWLKTTLKYAKQAKDSDLIIKSVDQRSKLAIKKRNYRKAYEVNQEAFDYFSKGGNSLSQLERNFTSQKVEIERETNSMKSNKRDLEAEIARLEREKNNLSKDKKVLTEKQEVLVQKKQEADSLITQKEEAIADLSVAKLEAEDRAKKREKDYKKLKRKELEQRLNLKEKENELMAVENKIVLENERNERNLLLAGLASAFMVLLAIVFYSRYRTKKNANNKLEEQNKIIEEERERSDELLLNILPANIAEELKENGKAKAQKFNDTSVLLADFKNFTAISERLTPEQLVKELDYCFRGFDFIISQYSNIEKIKTIGDAYMCASGLVNRKTVPVEIVKAALEMQEFLEDYKKDRSAKGLQFFEARIGIHTGPVVAGVVGVNKFAYDIWGDTVNIASRLESNCEEGKVNISSATFNEVKYKFECDYRGKIAAKNKGQIDMYYVRKAI